MESYAITFLPSTLVKKSKKNTEKTIITQNDIQGSGATTLQQVLQTLGGIQLQDTSGNGSQVLLSMRGFGSNASSNTLLMINGIPLTNPDMAPPDLNAIPFQDIEYVEIFAGSESVLYGDQAVGGTINIYTKNHLKNEKLISCLAGSYNQKLCTATLSHQIKNIRFSINALKNHTDNYRIHNDYDQNRILGSVNYAYSKGSLTFNYQIADENMQYPGALTAQQVSENRRQANNDTDFFKDNSGFYHLNAKHAMNTDWFLSVDMLRRDMDGNGVLMSPFTQSRTVNYLKPEFQGSINTVNVKTGIDIENDTYELTTDFGNTNDKLLKYGGYSLINFPLTKLFGIELGLRGARQNNQLISSSDSTSINSAFVTTTELKCDVTNQSMLYVRRAGSFRFPKADENASASPEVNGLKTQYGISYETGWKYHWKNIISQLSLYQLNLKNEITFDPNQTPQDPFGTNRNLNPTVRKGFSISEKIPLSQKIILNGQYNLINARFQDGLNVGNRIPLVAESNLQMGLHIKLTDFLAFYSEAIYTGNQYAANDDANIGGAMGGYTTYNLNLRYTHKEWTISLRANNITNKYYYFYSVFNTYNDTESFYPAPGRNALLTITYSEG